MNQDMPTIDEIATELRQAYLAETDEFRKGQIARYLLSYKDGNRSDTLRAMMAKYLAHNRRTRR